MFGITAIIRLITILAVIGSLGGAAWYITGLRADLAISQENEKKLQEGILQQQELMEQMKADFEMIQKVNSELAKENERQKADVNALQNKFNFDSKGAPRDLGQNAIVKPNRIESAINRGTVNAMRCLELAAGAPLNEQEKAAKTPVEANRECPSLIDPSYRPVLP